MRAYQVQTMKRNTPSTLEKHRQHGLSLIELMVSITIGLILVVAILSAYVGTSGASKVAEAQGRMNEDANAALTILTQQLRMAGYNPKQPSYPAATPVNPVFDGNDWHVRGCDGTFGNADTAANTLALTCTSGGPNSVEIAYEADAFNTVKTTAGLATDCLGSSLPTVTTTLPATTTTVSYSTARNVYFIGTSGVITSPSLYCQTLGNAAKQPLVENIEDMQFIYGTALPTGTSTNSIAGYLNAGELAAETSLAALTTEQRWGKVTAVRICVLVRSEQPVALDSASAKYMSCPTSSTNNGTLTTAPDLRLRRAYSTTVVLRNRVAP
jgi:type IV pilus assembly protein PilW